MDGRPAFDVRQDIIDAEYGAGHARLGPTGGQIAFDFLFGIVTPLVLLLADPALFEPSVADRATLPPYLAGPIRTAMVAALAALLLWGVTGMRRAGLALLLAGPFAVATLLFAFLGLVLVPFGITHSDFLSGWVGFTPWFTAFVFGRHCVLACRVGGHRSMGLSVALLAATSIGLTLALLGVVRSRVRRAQFLESCLLSESRSDFEYALSDIRDADELDMDRIAEAYYEMGPDDPRRTRLADCYLSLTGAPIETAIDRLFPRRRAASAADEPSKEKQAEDATARVVARLFSTDYAEHLKAADELVTYDPDPKVLEAIAREYVKLVPEDPRRGWIERAYTSLNSDGETIHDAVRRLAKAAGAKGKLAPPSPGKPSKRRPSPLPPPP